MRQLKPLSCRQSSGHLKQHFITLRLPVLKGNVEHDNMPNQMPLQENVERFLITSMRFAFKENRNRSYLGMEKAEVSF